ncbi:MAG: hypothetical protein ACK5LZ_04320 [Anaerorhabdus sp.]
MEVGVEELVDLALSKGVELAVTTVFPELVIAKYGADILVGFVISLVSTCVETSARKEKLEKNIEGAMTNLENNEELTEISNNAGFSHAVVIQVDLDGGAYNGGVEILPTQATVATLKAINEAAIISQGKGATGYEAAMEASYATAVANGASVLDEDAWKAQYTYTMKQYNEQLQEMRGLSFAEMVERYEEFESILDLIESNLNILGA